MAMVRPDNHTQRHVIGSCVAAHPALSGHQGNESICNMHHCWLCPCMCLSMFFCVGEWHAGTCCPHIEDPWA